jgi:hypothetical protein
VPNIWFSKTTNHACNTVPMPDGAPTFVVKELLEQPRPPANFCFTTAAMNLDASNFRFAAMTPEWVGSVLLPEFLRRYKPAFVFVSEAYSITFFKMEGYEKYSGKLQGGDEYAFIVNTEWDAELAITLHDRFVTFVAVHKSFKYKVVVIGCHLTHKETQQFKTAERAALVRWRAEVLATYRDTDHVIVFGDMNAAPEQLKESGAEVLYKFDRFTQGTTTTGTLIDNCFFSTKARRWCTVETQLSHFVIMQLWAAELDSRHENRGRAAVLSEECQLRVAMEHDQTTSATRAAEAAERQALMVIAAQLRNQPKQNKKPST